jgi:hypothetical protein
MGFEMQPGVMRAQNVKKKLTFTMELEVFFTIIQQTYSKTCYEFYE